MRQGDKSQLDSQSSTVRTEKLQKGDNVSTRVAMTAQQDHLAKNRDQVLSHESHKASTAASKHKNLSTGQATAKIAAHVSVTRQSIKTPCFFSISICKMRIGNLKSFT